MWTFVTYSVVTEGKSECFACLVFITMAQIISQFVKKKEETTIMLYSVFFF